MLLQLLKQFLVLGLKLANFLGLDLLARVQAPRRLDFLLVKGLLLPLKKCKGIKPN